MPEFKVNQLVWVFSRFKGVIITGQAYGHTKINVKYKDDKGTTVVSYVSPADVKARA